ncbi:MAG: AAA family ATPase [Myxococcota bacterium]
MNPQTASPLLIVVTGRPASGKTTLAHRLAREIRCPVLCRDELKEGIVNSIDCGLPPPEEIQRSVYETFFAAIELLVGRGVSLVAEAAFQHALWAARLEPLAATTRLRILDCHVGADLARSRFEQRGRSDPLRSHFHGDTDRGAVRGGPLIERYEPPRLPVPTLRVETGDGYRPSFEELVAFARS